jgi:hypothetical protein
LNLQHIAFLPLVIVAFDSLFWMTFRRGNRDGTATARANGPVLATVSIRSVLEKADVLRPRGAIGEGSPRAARVPGPIFASTNFIFCWGIFKTNSQDIGKRILRATFFSDAIALFLSRSRQPDVTSIQ